MIDAILADLAPHGWPLVGLALGWITHIWTAAREMSAVKQERVWPWAFIARRPMRCGISVLGAVGGYFVLIEMGIVSIAAAYGVGLLSDLIPDSLRGAAAKRLGLDATQERPVVDLSETTVLRSRDEA